MSFGPIGVTASAIFARPHPENRRYLRRGGNHYIIGERLRSGSPAAEAALSRQGRYQEVAASLRVKEVRIAEDERFVICHSPTTARKSASAPTSSCAGSPSCSPASPRTPCAATWPELRRQLDRIQVGAFTGTTGTFRQRTEISPAQAAILEQPGIDPPSKIYQLTPAATR